MPNHGTDVGIPGGAHNNPYMSDGPSEAAISPVSWRGGMNKANGDFPAGWWAASSNPREARSAPYPPRAFTPWSEVTETRIEPTMTVPVQNASHLRTANPLVQPSARGQFNFEHAGDLSRSTTGHVPGLYPQLGGCLTSGEEPTTTTTTTSSNGKNALAHEMSQRMRSKVRMAARVSQLNMFNLRSRRRKTTRMHESTRGRPKRRRNTRTSSVTIGSTTVMGGPKFSVTPGEGYHNMNVITDSFEFDELGSLDNDDFLCSLEKAVYPGLEGSQLSSSVNSQAQRFQYPSANDGHFRSLGIPPNIVYPMSDFQSLATADLSLGNGSNSTMAWRPLPPDLENSNSTRSSQPNGFRFPTPGPPVFGWAHQLAEISRQSETQSTQETGNASDATRSPPSAPPAPRVEPSAPIAPVIQPPPDVSSPPSRLPSITPLQTAASMSAAIPRRRAQKRAKTRQQSEPRAAGSRLAGDIADPFGNIDSSAGFDSTRAAPNRSIAPVIVPRGVPGFFTPHSRPAQPHLTASFTQPTSPVKVGTPSSQLIPSPLTSDPWNSGPKHPLDRFDPHDSTNPTSVKHVGALTDKICVYGRQPLITSGSSSSGTGRASDGSTTAMLPVVPKERSVSASRHPLLPDAIHQHHHHHPQSHSQQHYRSPSFPDFFMSTGPDIGLNGLVNDDYKFHVSPGVFSASPQPVWTDMSQSDHP
ncbi:unnamed protein product [Echinostoma caproni]|uniref:PHD-type domain-containing protein n=1 Tax=Echinostoma caproni TaxID=27848 RepID=A0A183A820_9TREM|nr:unnamed protein product [Echinostoma caproni]